MQDICQHTFVNTVEEDRMLNDRRTDKVVSFIVDSDYYKKNFEIFYDH